jgi:hypothetical protein
MRNETNPLIMNWIRPPWIESSRISVCDKVLKMETGHSSLDGAATCSSILALRDNYNDMLRFREGIKCVGPCQGLSCPSEKTISATQHIQLCHDRKTQALGHVFSIIDKMILFYEEANERSGLTT